MNSLIFGILTLISVSSFAATTLKTTDIKISTAPTASQLEAARAILLEAIEAQEAGNTGLFLEKLSKAKRFQEFSRVTKTFKAAFITMYDTTKINYFSNDEIKYEVNIEDTCFVGAVEEATSLLSAAIKQSALGSDELWYENPRAKNGKSITVDLVDGPNDLRTRVTVKSCK